MNDGLIKKVVYSTWIEAKKSFVHDIYGDEEPEIGWLFRGQSSETWKLISSFDRLYSNVPNKMTYEKTTLEELERLLEKTRNSQDLNHIQLRALAQHYGMSTRLLDWSYSPYIALFFAFANPAPVNERYVSVFALNRKHDVWRENSGCEIIDGWHFENEHLKKQQGAFTLLIDSEILEDFVGSYNGSDKRYALIRILISKHERTKILKELRLMNITYETLFSGINSLVKASEMEAQIRCNII